MSSFSARDRVHHVDDHHASESVHIPVPTMSIAILIVGTHGDVLPFMSLALALKSAGHRVRLATHVEHRSVVAKYGVEFFPLAGEPKQLSAWMVQSGGTIVGEALQFEPRKLAMLKEIVHTLWPAVMAKDPEDPQARPFVADFIIANPVTFGHVHVAEALGVPLHMCFPQPWLPTRAFPHPMAGIPYHWVPSDLNRRSYGVVDEAMWLGNSSMLNIWRWRHLRLPPILAFGGNLLPRFHVPFSFMWSPSFVPKPLDWPAEAEVVGVIHPPASGSAGSAFDEAPFADLVAWLRAGPPPIFVGFGSMVIPDTSRLSAMIVEASQRTGLRVLVQSSWSKLETRAPSGGRCFDIGPAPHDWLLPKVAAVVHHGGAGTTAAGLRAGKPTLVCPFFGDQHFWGDMVRRAGVGPPPCPVGKLTAQLLADKFLTLAAPETQASAKALAEGMRGEDGVAAAVAHIEKWLPRHNMLCDVSLLLEPPEARIARYAVPNWLGLSPLKLSAPVVAVCRDPALKGLSTSFERLRTQSAARHATRTWGLGRVSGIVRGCFLGIVAMVLELIMMFVDTVSLSKRFYASGGCCYMVLGWFYIVPVSCVTRGFLAPLVFFDRILTGGYNHYCELRYGVEEAHLAQVTYVIDPRMDTTRVRLTNTDAWEEEMEHAAGTAPDRAAKLLDALALARRARSIYDSFSSRQPGNRVHVSGRANVVRLARKIAESGRARNALRLSPAAGAALARRLGKLGTFCSFSQFCILLTAARAEHGASAKEPKPRLERRAWKRQERARGGASGRGAAASSGRAVEADEEQAVGMPVADAGLPAVVDSSPGPEGSRDQPAVSVIMPATHRS